MIAPSLEDLMEARAALKQRLTFVAPAEVCRAILNIQGDYISQEQFFQLRELATVALYGAPCEICGQHDHLCSCYP